MQKKLAIVTTHPIQYNAPLFRRLAVEEGMELKVFYTWGAGSMKKFDPGFGKVVEWDVPLLEGYSSVFVENTAREPGSHHFRGIRNPTLVRELESWNPDALMVYGWPFESHLRVLRHFHGKRPLFFRGDSTISDRQPLLREWLRKQVLSRVYQTIDVAFYAGSRSKAYFLAHGVPDERLVLMPHAVDNDRFRDGGRSADTPAWRRCQGVAPGALLFLYAGKLEARKNVGLLVDAFREAKLQDAVLVVAGNGPEEEALKKMAGADTRIRFLPFQNQAEMPVVLAAADVVVLPSKEKETWGLVVNEAMACGRPVVVSAACGCAPDLVVPGVNGYVFRNNDRADLVDKLQRLARDREALPAMGRQSEVLIRRWSYAEDCAALRHQMQRINQR